MDATEIQKDLETRGIRRIKLGGIDLDGVMRGKYVSGDKFSSALEKGLGFCDVIFGWDSNDVLYENAGVEFTGWHTGYPDTLAKIQPETYRIIPWEDSTAFFLVDFYGRDGGPLPISPRQVLRGVVGKAEDLGFCPLMASEYEFFIFEETSASAHKKGFTNLEHLSQGMFGYSVVRASTFSDLVHDILESMEAFRCPLEGFHTETGPGVYETAITYDEAVESADRAALFKTGMKEIAARHELLATFMAKFDPSLPGSSGHVHQSLWDRDRKANLFADANDARGMSATFRAYLAGVVNFMPEMLVLYAPTINSYKRLVEGCWAPTRANWGLENRTTAARVINGPGPSATRIEVRVVGSDSNPYLAFAGALASGLEGIEQGLEPPAFCAGNGYEDPEGLWEKLPSTLAEATERFNESAVARKWLGDAFVNHFVATRRWEVRQFNGAVTDWERKRYLEVI